MSIPIDIGDDEHVAIILTRDEARMMACLLGCLVGKNYDFLYEDVRQLGQVGMGFSWKDFQEQYEDAWTFRENGSPRRVTLGDLIIERKS